MTVTSRSDLLAEGWSLAEIRAKLSRRDWTAMAPGRYLLGPRPQFRSDEFLLRTHAMMMRFSSPEIVASHSSAAAVHGLPLHTVPTKVEITRVGNSGSRSTRGARIRGLLLGQRDRTVINGIAVTTVARTLVDLARHASAEQAIVAADHALHHQLVTSDEVIEAFLRLSTAARRPTVRRVLARADGRAESAKETIQRLILADGGIADLELQVEIHDEDGKFVARVDGALLEHGIATEYDGEQKYLKFLKPGQDAASAVMEEKRREDAVRALRWSMVRHTKYDLARPRDMVEQVKRTIRSRRGLPPVLGSVRVRPPITIDFAALDDQ